MSVLSAKQRARLTPNERKRVGQLIAAIVLDKLTDDNRAELAVLKAKMGPK